jgi:multidrug efflux system membrane fusion protein
MYRTGVSILNTCLAFVGLLGSLIALSGCGSRPEPEVVARPVKSLEVTAEAAYMLRDYSGRVDASQRAIVAFRVAGPLVELNAEKGEQVKKGALLAKIDPRDYQTALAEATGALSEARDQVPILEEQLNAENAKLARAEGEVARNIPLKEKQIISEREFDALIANRDVARAAVAAKKRELDATQSKIATLTARQEAAQNDYEDTFLKAAFDGVIADRYVENHEIVQRDQAILLLQQLKRVKIVVDVPESDITAQRGEDKPMDEIVATFDARPGEEFPLDLLEFSTEADTATQTYRVTFILDTPEGLNLFPGMTCQVVRKIPIAGADEGDVFLVPSTALFDGEKGRAVWVIGEDNKVKQRPVTTGDMVGDRIVITTGLAKGETIATAGVNTLEDGYLVEAVGDDIREVLK